MVLDRNFLQLFLIAILPDLTYAQLPGLEKLTQSNFEVSEVAQYNPGLSTFFEIEEAQAPYMNGITQHLIKNTIGLYLMPDGTGRIYKVEADGKNLKIIRQDSTVFFGYNFGFFPFSYQDTLYSFGGYGFWKFNGHLRTFVAQKGEWELENLNREIPFTRVGYPASPKWFDQKNGKLWIGFSLDSHEGIKKEKEFFKNVVDSVYVLSLPGKFWTTVGGLTSTIREIANTPVNRNLGSSPWGQLIHDPTESTIYLLDFPHNDLFKLNEKDTRTITKLLGQTSIVYFKDSTLFVGVASRGLDSVDLSKSKFIKTGSRIYYPAIITSLSMRSFSFDGAVWSIITSIVVIGISGFVYFKKQKSTHVDHTHRMEKGPRVQLFDDKEMEIVRLVVTKSAKGSGASIDEINRSLGVFQKNVEIQKKQRSETLISINKKWRYRNGNQQLLIKKRRTEPDKRSFEYFIDYENLQSVNALLE